MADEPTNSDLDLRTKVFVILERLGFEEFYEDEQGLDELLIRFALVMIVSEVGKSGGKRERKEQKRVGRPKKLRPQLRPVDLYLQTQRIKQYFEKTVDRRLTQREAVKLMINNNIIPNNSEIEHIEKQVSAGKKILHNIRIEVERQRLRAEDGQN